MNATNKKANSRLLLARVKTLSSRNAELVLTNSNQLLLKNLGVLLSGAPILWACGRIVNT